MSHPDDPTIRKILRNISLILGAAICISITILISSLYITMDSHIIHMIYVNAVMLSLFTLLFGGLFFMGIYFD